MADDKPLLERLARESRQAALAAQSALPDPQIRGGSPTLGSIWAYSEFDSFFVLIQRDPADAERFLVVPADHRQQIGSRDVAFHGTEGQAPLILRCGCPLWLSHRQLDEGENVGRIDDATRSRALGVLDGAESDHPERLDIDQETAYREWLREGPDADRERLLARLRRRTRLPLAAALAGFIALGAWVVSQQLRTDPPLQATLIERGMEIMIGDTLRSVEDEPLPSQPYWQAALYWGPETPTFPTYRVELIDATGRAIVRLEMADENRDDTGLMVPAAQLRPGFHQLRVIGINGDEEQLLTEHSFRFVRPRAP